MFAFGANQKLGGLGQLRGTGIYCFKGQVEFFKFQTGIFVESKAPSSCYPVHSYIQGFSLADCSEKFPFPFISWQLLLHVHVQIRISFFF